MARAVTRSRTSKPAAASPAKAPVREPNEEQVRERAHAIWMEEGMPEGREVDHWIRARRELEQEAEGK